MMILDIHGANPDRVIESILERGLPPPGLRLPFTSIEVARDGKHALEMETPDKIILVGNGFNTRQEKNDLVKFFKAKRSIPRIMQVSVFEDETDMEIFLESDFSPYSCVFCMEDDENFYVTLVNSIFAETIIEIVKDIYGPDDAVLVARFFARLEKDEKKIQKAREIIREALLYGDSGDDIPELY